MRCHEIQEQFVDLLYQEPGTAPASPELQEHLRSCSACQRELAELKELRATLRVWRDEPPLRPVTVPRREPVRRRLNFPSLSPAVFLRYAAIAVLLTLSILALSNAEFRWDRDGVMFQTHLLSRQASPASSDYYTKEEVTAILIKVMNETYENNKLMIQRGMDTIDRERQSDLRLVASQFNTSRNKN